MTSINFEITISIKKKRQDIFHFLTNFSNHKSLFKANIDSWQVSEGPAGAGTTMIVVAKFLGLNLKEVFVVTEFEPCKILAKESLPGSTFYTRDKIVLQDIPHGTLVTFSCYAELKGILKWFKGILKRELTKAMTKDWETIRENFESGVFKDETPKNTIPEIREAVLEQ